MFDLCGSGSIKSALYKDDADEMEDALQAAEGFCASMSGTVPDNELDDLKGAFFTRIGLLALGMGKEGVDARTYEDLEDVQGTFQAHIMDIQSQLPAKAAKAFKNPCPWPVYKLGANKHVHTKA